MMSSARQQDLQRQIAARAIAKGLVKRLAHAEWHRKGNEAQCAQRASEAILQESRRTGISAVWIKSCMLRIQRGVL